jgi:cellulose synthase/poly-beta-1,6-N-acetylglucosamine synthase-like glycosyltransferase/peptidoglycan/xylan/chitin deacetylase (PgdA/CDA1 family)
VTVFVAAFFTSLSLGVVAKKFSGHSAGASATGATNPALAGAGPVLDLAGADTHSSARPPRTVALTFDDGPDRRWTPAILRVLERHRVPATFFVVGSRVLKNPRLVRAELRAGHEVGSHTFSHARMGQLAVWQEQLQLTLTEKAIAGATGKATALYRPPYSSAPVDLTGAELSSARRAGRSGYLVVMGDTFARDWLPGSVDQLVTNALPPPGQGAVIMFHDGGGNRARSVAAVDRLIVVLQQRGYRFTTVSDFAGLAPGTALRRADPGVEIAGRLLVASTWVTTRTSSALGLLIAGMLVVYFLRGAAVVTFARRQVVHHRRQGVSSAFAPPVSIIVPAFNEESGIEAAVRSLVASDYADYEVIVVDDGSTDRSLDIVTRLQFANLRVIAQPNAGKAGALNTGIAAARHSIVVLVDADTLFEPTTLARLVSPLSDNGVGAVSGNVKVGNRRGLLGRWQHIEYVISCSVERRMFDQLGCMPCVPGAAGAFRRAALEQVGGVSSDTLAEDTDLTMAVLRAGWRIAYEPEARAWTEVPLTVRELWRQRYRWSYGTMQAMWKHRRAVLERGPGGRLGRRGLPFLAFYTLVLPVLSPAVDLFALYGLLMLDPFHALAMWSVINLCGLALGAYAFSLDDERMAPLWLLPLQQFVYRQLMYTVVLVSLKAALLMVRVRWQKLAHRGDVSFDGMRTGEGLTAPSNERPAAAAASSTGPPVTFPTATAFSESTSQVFVDVGGTRTRRRRAIGHAVVLGAGLVGAAVFGSLITPRPAAPVPHALSGDRPVVKPPSVSVHGPSARASVALAPRLRVG